MDDEKRLDMKKLGEIRGKKVSVFSADRLKKKMSLSPGTVSLFGLLNNKEKDIKVYLDKEMLSEEYMTFHPNDNTKLFLLAKKICINL